MDLLFFQDLFLYFHVLATVAALEHPFGTV
jgi:hypothetical protein